MSDSAVRTANMFLWRFFFVRLSKVFDPETKEQTGWAFLGPVLPFTGWGKNSPIGEMSAVYMWSI